MKKTVAVETEETDNCNETESLIENNPRKMSDHEIEASPTAFVTSEEVSLQIK